jgi:hypothetical protein
VSSEWTQTEVNHAARPTGVPCRTPGKVCYASRRMARATARRHRHLRLSAYLCSCGFWHVTSMTAAKKAWTREVQARLESRSVRILTRV